MMEGGNWLRGTTKSMSPSGKEELRAPGGLARGPYIHGSVYRVGHDANSSPGYSAAYLTLPAMPESRDLVD